MPRHILVFGGTSPSGIDFCLAALRDGHTLTLFVRNASKLPAEISSNVTIVVGQLNDAQALEGAIEGGAKACVSFLGPVVGLKKGQMPVADGYRIILPLLQKYAYTRCLFLSTASHRDPKDSFSILYSMMVWMIYLFVSPAYVEITTMTPPMMALPEEMGVTVYRVPVLGTGEAREVKAGFVGEVGIKLERKALAEWVLKEMEEGKWVGKCPAVANA